MGALRINRSKQALKGLRTGRLQRVEVARVVGQVALDYPSGFSGGLKPPSDHLFAENLLSQIDITVPLQADGFTLRQFSRRGHLDHVSVDVKDLQDWSRT